MSYLWKSDALIGMIILIVFLSIASFAKEAPRSGCETCTIGPCLEKCFEVCSSYGGSIGSSNYNWGEIDRCDMCAGKVITVRDDAHMDGSTIKVCAGKLGPSLFTEGPFPIYCHKFHIKEKAEIAGEPCAFKADFKTIKGGIISFSENQCPKENSVQKKTVYYGVI